MFFRPDQRVGPHRFFLELDENKKSKSPSVTPGSHLLQFNSKDDPKFTRSGAQ
jgi:hypothetical protein